jgi:hypothetical protein
MQTPTLSLAARYPGLEDLIEKARAYIHAAKAPATLRAYRTDFEDFTRLCEAHLPATPTTVALYIADRAGSLRSATITRRLTSIASEVSLREHAVDVGLRLARSAMHGLAHVYPILCL